MSYRKGELFIDKEWYDEERDKVAQLPHSCDEWIIGGVKEIDDLIADLQEAKAILADNEEGI